MLETRKTIDHNQISEKKFGITFGTVFLLLAFATMFYGWFSCWIPLAMACLFLAAAFFLPSVLYYPNRVWFYFGLLLQKITTPIILGVMFFVLLFPIGMVLRLLGKGSLRKEFKDTSTKTYWVEREKNEIKFEHIF
jgi:hypothetical protein